MNRTPQIQPGCIRVQAQIGEMSGACDYIVEKLPQWLSTMERVCVPPLVRGAEDSAQMAGYMTYGAAAQGQWDLACISALWIVLYGPTVRDTTLADFCARQRRDHDHRERGRLPLAHEDSCPGTCHSLRTGRL